MVKKEDKSLFIGHCWPGSSYYADFINYNGIQASYNSFFKNEEYFLYSDNIHTWIDMNEPSVFESEEVTMPHNCLHFDGENHISHHEVHNLYGHFYHKVSYNALKNRYNDSLRPFVLSRSFYAGSQQYGFIWTGDNRASIDFMEYSIDMLKTISSCGLSACGADVGGFFQNPSPELLKNWFKLGVFYPFFRGHSHNESIRREPWYFEEDVLNSIKSSILLRYKLILFWYTKFYENSVTGLPIFKPLFFNYRKYIKDLLETSIYEDQFLVGDEIIVLPCFKKNEILLPEIFEENYFYELSSGNLFLNTSDRKELISLVVGGSIIPWYENVG